MKSIRKTKVQITLVLTMVIALTIPVISIGFVCKGNESSGDAPDNLTAAALCVNTWTNKTPSTHPDARDASAMVYDTSHDRMILFGGWASGVGRGDTWIYNYTDDSWTNVTTASTKPSAREKHAMVYDSTNDRVILFGGDPAGPGYDDSTWVYNFSDNTWHNMNPSGDKPSSRIDHAMVYDSTHDRTILFGGSRLQDQYKNDTWIYNYTDNSWTNVTNPANVPLGRYSHSMTYDSTHDRTILFGGWSGSKRGDTWIYNYTDNSWTNVTTASTKPSARDNHRMAYDSTNKRTILFGGYPAGSPNDETWVYNYNDNSWTNMTPTSAPSIRTTHAMAYDSTNNRIILFSGVEQGWLDDTWEYCFSGGSSDPGNGNGNGDPDVPPPDATGLIIIYVVVGGVVVGIVVIVVVNPDFVKKLSGKLRA